jgi:hypothetical protein
MLVALPAVAQVGVLTGQTLFFNQASNAHAGDYLSADAGLIYNTNAELAENGASATIAAVGLSGNTAHDSTFLSYHLDSDIALLKYLSGDFPTQPSGYLDGEAELKAVPGYVSWIGRETFAQVLIDPYLPATTNNLESINYLTTGPRFRLRPTLRTTITVEALYSLVNTSSPAAIYTNLDNHRYGGNVKAERAFSSNSSLYLKGNYEKVDFKDQVNNTNFSTAQALLGYHVTDGRTDLDLSGGYTQVRTGESLVDERTVIGYQERPQSEQYGAPSWLAHLSRLITPNQRLSLSASQQINDPAGQLRLDFDAPVPTIAPQQYAVGEVLKSRVFSIDWRFEMLRTSLDIGLADSTQRYDFTPQYNGQQKILTVMLARRISPVINWDVGITYLRSDYLAGASFDQVNALTNLRWQIARRVGLRFFYAHSSYGSVGQNQVGVMASYALTEASAAATETPALMPVSPMSTMQRPP